MSWEIIDIDERETAARYGTGLLTSEIIAASHLDETSIFELLRGDDHLSTSGAACVLQACERIRMAQQNHEKIFIGGDYDADGICSTAIMKKTLDVLGIENGYYIPDRFREGYGLSARTVELAYQKGYDIIMTVDNGVKAHEALQKARDLGMYVIVTDHHQIEEEIEADIVVHPDYMESEYAYLSGAGVVFEMAGNLIGNSYIYDDMTAMCACALIGDVMPLWRETRKIVKRGLSILKQGRPRSLSVLLRPGQPVDETAVAFQIVPKLNSVGRMNDISNVNTLVRYLLAENEKTISSYSTQLNLVNEKRKELSQTETAAAEKLMNDDPFQVIYDPSFHEGICGLTAGRIASQYHKPTLVMAKSGEFLKGSGRSVPGFNLFDFFSDFDETTAFGGHEQAVGLTIRESDFESFRQHIRKAFDKCSFVYEDTVQQAILIREDEITFENIVDLQRLSPYPKEIMKPYFALRNPVITEIKKTAKTKKLMVSLPQGMMEAVIYDSRNLQIPSNISTLTGTLSINRFRGKITLQMIVEDIA